MTADVVVVDVQRNLVGFYVALAMDKLVTCRKIGCLGKGREV